MENGKTIQKGKNKYIKFLSKLGINYYKIITPHTYILTKLGNYPINSKEFMHYALSELLKTYPGDSEE